MWIEGVADYVFADDPGYQLGRLYSKKQHRMPPVRTPKRRRTRSTIYGPQEMTPRRHSLGGKPTMRAHPKKMRGSHSREEVSQNEFGNLHSGATFKVMSIKPGKGTLRHVSGAFNKLMDIRGYRFTQTSGLQGVNSLYLSGTNSQWTSSTVAPFIYDSPIAYFDMNPYSKISGSSSAFFPPGLSPKTDTLAFVKDDIVIDMTNFTNVGVTVQLFAFRCKKYTTFDPITLWAQANIDESQGGTPMVFPSAGTTAATLGAVGVNMPHQQPHHSLISDCWTICGSTICVLGGGASQRVKIADRPNHIGMRDRLIEQPYRFVPGCLNIIAIAIGDVVQDVTTGIIPTYGPTNLGFCVNSKKHFQAVMGNAARIKTQLADSFVPVNATIANLHEVTVVDGSGVVSL